MIRTPTYGLSYLREGEILRELIDYRRFVTLDYNLGTYVGILGNGVITGWMISVVSGRTVKVTPGSGFISGYYTETPYYLDPATKVPKTKSAAQAAGDDIVEEMPGWSSGDGSWRGVFFDYGGRKATDGKIFRQLGPDGEDENHDGIAEGVLLPHYKSPPTGFFNDPYVKAVPQSSDRFTLPDDDDSYIFASRQSSDPSGTFAEFFVSSSDVSSSENVLLAKVSVRSGVVTVDYGETMRLSGLQGVVQELARDLINSHRHGGTRSYDPARIRLATDVRSCVLSDFSGEGKATYTVLAPKRTTESVGHQHTYELDADGNGITQLTLGDVEFHYHEIASSVVGLPVANYGSSLEDHTHDLSTDERAWTASSQVKVYVNGEEADPATYVLDADATTVEFDGGIITHRNPTYHASFNVDSSRVYEYEASQPSLKRFVLQMMLDFTNKYTDELGISDERRTVLRNPFQFLQLDGRDVEETPEGYVYVSEIVPIATPVPSEGLVPENQINSIQVLGLNQLDDQVAMAEAELETSGDSFVLLPYVSKFVPVELKEAGQTDVVRIEILDDVEVTGVLKPENIFFVRAEKFAEGKFDSARIPFLSHIGRLSEPFESGTFPMSTVDGSRYVPRISHSSETDAHAHRVYVDDSGDGSSLAVVVNDKISVYQTKWKEVIRISHGHVIKDCGLQPVVSSGINVWLGLQDVHPHSHDVRWPIFGNAKTVFSMAEDGDGNRYFGTSDGLVVIPVSHGYRTDVAGKPYYDFDTTVAAALQRAVARYSNDTGQNLVIDAVKYAPEIAAAEAALTAEGDSYSFEIEANVNGEVLQFLTISVTMVAQVPVDNFYSETIKVASDVQPGEIVVRETKPEESAYDLTSLTNAYPDNPEAIQNRIDDDTEPESYLVRQYFQERTVWNIHIRGDAVYAVTQGGVIVGNPKTSWAEADKAPACIISRKTIETANGYSWMVSDIGLLVSRPPSVGRAYSPVSYADLGYDSFDLFESQANILLVATEDGLYRVSDFGAIATKVLAVLNVRDIAAESPPVIYCRTKVGVIYRSADAGVTWLPAGAIPDEHGETRGLFAAFGKLFASSSESLLVSNDEGATWSRTSVGKVLSFAWSAGSAKAYFGTDNAVYETSDGDVFSTSVSFDGAPVPSLTVDGRELDFGYSYNNWGSFSLWEENETDSTAECALVYDEWKAQNGSWDGSKPYEIFIDGKKVYSTKDGTDRRDELGFKFVPVPSSGILDFSVVSDLAVAVASGDRQMTVSSVEGFSVGDQIALVKPPDKVATATIGAITGNVLTLTDALLVDVSLPAKVQLLSVLPPGYVVQGNFYDSYLLNIGENTHEGIEDKLSGESAGAPYHLSEVHIRNLSELVLAVKYGLPDIDAHLKNWLAYMMRYGRTPASPNYIGDAFDTEMTLMNANPMFTSVLAPLVSGSVNRMLVGYGSFTNDLFAGTDVGLFASVFDAPLEANWIRIAECPAGSVYDVMLVGGARLLVAGSAGTYISAHDNLRSWRSAGSSVTLSLAAQFCRTRWVNSTRGEKHWWNSWNGTINLVDSDITNRLVVGGRDFLMTSGDDGKSWEGARFPAEVGNVFSARSFLAVSDGTALAGIDGVSADSSSHVVATAGGGSEWGLKQSISGYAGTIVSVSVTEANNSQLAVQFRYPSSSAVIRNNSMVGLHLVAKGRPWLVAANSSKTITVQGEEASRLLAAGDSFAVSPPSVRALAESDDGTVLAGLDNGMLHDRRTYLHPDASTGFVTGINKSGSVLAVDITGTVNSVFPKFSTQLIGGEVDTTEVDCTLDRLVSVGELVGRKLTLLEQNYPTVTILSPMPNQVLTSTSVTVRVALTSFGLGTSGNIAIKLDGRSPEYASMKTHVLTDVPAGSHVLSVYLVDMANRPISTPGASEEISFTTVPSGENPSIEFVYPGDGQTVQTKSITAVVKVTNFNTFQDGSLQYSLDSGPPVAVPPSDVETREVVISGLVEGLHSLRFFLADTSGEEIGVSIEHTFTVSVTTQPVIEITAPVDGITLMAGQLTVTYLITNFSVPSAGMVRVLIDGAVVATSQDPQQIVLSGIANGSHTLVIQLADTDGKPLGGSFSSDSLVFTVDPSAQATPYLFIDSPPDGAVYASGTQYVNIYYQVSNFDIPDAGGLVVESGGNSTFVLEPSVYKFPVNGNGTYSVVLTLATSILEKLTNPEAKATARFVVGSTKGLAQTPQQVPQQQSVQQTRAPQPPEQTSGMSEPIVRQSPTEAADSQTFTILSNSPSAADGSTVIKINTDAGDRLLDKAFKIVGSQSVIYISFVQPVKSGEFKGGKLYVDPSEAYNGGKTYGVVDNTPNSVTVDVVISPPSPSDGSSESSSESPEQEAALHEGQTVFMVPPDGTSTIWVDFVERWADGILAGETIRVDHGVTGSSVRFKAVNNTSRSILAPAGTDPKEFYPGDKVVLESMAFEPLASFRWKKTTTDLDHYHDTELVGGLITGDVILIDFVSSAYVDIYVSVPSTENFNIPVVQDNPELLGGARITLFNPESPSVVFGEEIERVSPTKITVRVSDATHWDFDGSRPNSISAGFRFEIDATSYGRTSAIHYDDFAAISRNLISDADEGDDEITVENTVGFGGEVEIFDEKVLSERNSVASIISSTVLRLDYPTSRSYRVSFGAVCRARRNSFDETHVHLVKDAEVSVQNSEAYRRLGYAYEHNHVLSDLVSSISGILKDEAGTLYVSGSESRLYESHDHGQTWKILVDVNDYREGADEAGSVASLSFGRNNEILAGTDRGYAVVQSAPAVGVALPLELPEMELSSSSSMSSSSASSQSSFSSSSSSVSSSSVSSSSTSSASESSESSES